MKNLCQSQLTQSVVQISSYSKRTAVLLHEMKSPATVILMGVSSLQKEGLSEQNEFYLAIAQATANQLNQTLKAFNVLHHNQRLDRSMYQIEILLEKINCYLKILKPVFISFSKEARSVTSRHRLNLVIEEVERLKRMINSSSECLNRSSASKQPIEFSSLLMQAIQLIRISRNSTANLIRLKIPPRKFWILGNRDQLMQVIINLLNNACEANSTEEEVICTLKSDGSINRVELSILNYGDPIHPQILPILTEPFISTKSNGRGLGLAIVKQIIKDHSGSLNISSSEKLGTKIILHLPINLRTSSENLSYTSSNIFINRNTLCKVA